MMLDIILQPYVGQTRSYIKDTSDFLEKISSIELEEDDWLFTMDVTSLYTNIPHDEGIECIRNLLNSKRQNKLPRNHNLIKMLELVLKLNNFTFNSENYLQVNGTAMGTRVAPTYANLFMDSIERKYIYTYSKKPIVWFRFIDDVWGIFRGTELELKEFADYCNTFHNSIKFTMEYSRKSVTFLDVSTYRNKDRINSTLYVKPTDTHSYLDYGSCHPQSTKSSIPFSQFLRIRRNCTEWTEFLRHSIKLFYHFSLRGYPPTLTSTALWRVNRISQTEALRNSGEKRETQENLFCIIEYNPTNPEIKKWLGELWPILYRSSGTRKLIDMNIIYGFRKPKSLQDILVHTNIYGNSRCKKKPPKCNRKNCRHCPRIDKSGTVKSNSTGREYHSLVNVTCNSSNLIYMIECTICGIQYVGQTKNKILSRINQHYSSIKNLVDTPVSRHINSHSFEGFYPIRIYILTLIKEDADSIEGSRK